MPEIKSAEFKDKDSKTPAQQKPVTVTYSDGTTESFTYKNISHRLNLLNSRIALVQVEADRLTTIKEAIEKLPGIKE